MDTLQYRHLLIGQRLLWHYGRPKPRAVDGDERTRWALPGLRRMRLALGIHIHPTVAVRIHRALALLRHRLCPRGRCLALPALLRLPIDRFFVVVFGARIFVFGFLAREELRRLVVFIFEVQWDRDGVEELGGFAVVGEFARFGR